MKIVINTCYGGFGISKAAAQWLAERGCQDAINNLASDHFYAYSLSEDRNNPLLVEMVETLGSKMASGFCASLKVVEIPDGIEWEIDEYDGAESIHEVHQSWS
jgi:hypothetical protein